MPSENEREKPWSCSAIEAEGERWEAREQLLAEDLDKLREELIGYKDKIEGVKSTVMSEQSTAAEPELQEVRALRRDKEKLQLERDELRPKLAQMQVRVRRLEGTGSVEDEWGGRLWEAPVLAEGERGSHSTSERETGATQSLNAHAPTFRPEAPTHSRSLTASSSIGYP